MMTPEQYARHIDTEGGSATLKVEMKWSLWSAYVSTWEEQAPEALRHLRAMYNNTLTLELSSRKEIRYGTVTITGTSECEDTPGKLTATGRFEEHWDDIDDLMSTLGIEYTDDARAMLVERLPFADWNGTPGVYREFTVESTSVAELLQKIDAEEDALIEESSRLWYELETAP